LLWLKDKAKIQQLKFENRHWGFSPGTLWKMASLQLRTYLKQYLIIQRFSNNPERERVTYKLFATESTVTWDEIAQMIDGFSLPFFLQQMEKEWEENERPLIDKYFLLVRSRLLFRKGEWDRASALLDQILE